MAHSGTQGDEWKIPLEIDNMIKDTHKSRPFMKFPIVIERPIKLQTFWLTMATIIMAFKLGALASTRPSPNLSGGTIWEDSFQSFFSGFFTLF